MHDFWVVTLFQLQLSSEDRETVDSLALNEMDAIGIEEYSLSEAEVDELLGERSYSGGDLPIEVLDEVEDKLKQSPRSYRYFFSAEENAKNFLEICQRRWLSEAQLEFCPAQDWNAEWKKHYSPIQVDENLTIVPSWEKDSPTKSLHKIAINPGMGFGTGSHETTFLCLKLFTTHLLNQKLPHILDFGSGSGILGLATLKFFPEAKVDFYDIDPEANKNCYENALLNDLGESSFRLLLPEVRDRLLPEYNLVFANILENILAQECEALIRLVSPGGSLILSGLLRHQVPGIIQMYSRHLTLIEEAYKGDWSALLFQRSQ